MKCAHCGIEFDTNRSDQKYCSVKCRRAQERVVARGNRQLAVATCPVCGKEFVKHMGNEKYCSDDCRRLAKLQKDNNRARRKHPNYKPKRPVFDKVCPHCGKSFITTEATKKFCSAACFNAHMKKIQAMALAQEKAQALNNKAVSRPTKKLDDWAREAYQCGLDYGTYRALIGQGKTFEELKTQYEQRRAGI